MQFQNATQKTTKWVLGIIVVFGSMGHAKAHQIKRPEGFARVIASNISEQKASDSDQIQASLDLVKIQIKNQLGLGKDFLDKNKVLYEKDILSQTQAYEKLKRANEDQFCRVDGGHTFVNGEYLKLDDIQVDLKDKDFDIYETQIKFLNAKGSLVFNCKHTTPQLFLESFATLFQNYFVTLGLDNSVLADDQFKNPKTLKRQLNAIRIVNLNNLLKASSSDTRGPSFFFYDGKIQDADQALTLIKLGVGKMGCFMVDHSKKLDLDKTYISVRRGLYGGETPSDIPSASLYMMYRADRHNYFVLICEANKKTEWFELMNTMAGTLRFGVLERLQYNKIYDEVIKIQDELEAQK